MPTKHYIKHPVTPTDIGQIALRCRLSMRETQAEFAKRFCVTVTTVSNWETGKSFRIQKIHRLILDQLLTRLRREGMLIPEPVMTTILREDIERSGNALR